MIEPHVTDADFRLYLGDALTVLQELSNTSVHCIVTSPPYWGLRDYGDERQLGLEATPAAYVERLVGVFREARRVLRDDGTFWLNVGDSYVGGGVDALNAAPGLKPKDLAGIPWRLAFALQNDGWYLRSDIIWSKSNPMPESVTDRPTKAHEYLFLLTRSARYFYDADAIRETAEWARWGDQTNRKHEGSESADGWIGSQSKDEIQSKARGGGFSRKYAEQQPAHGAMRLERPADTGTRNARSVWEIATQSYAEAHFATFPEELARRCIAAGCPPDGTVLDPFMGSGTTALVARKLGRQCVGIELNEEYVALILNRTKQISLLSQGGEVDASHR